MMNLMHWRLLVAIAECATITRAAEQVGMTQSGASQALAQMEDMLGVQLFVRESRQALPTAIGLQVLAQARVMLEALAEVRRQVDAARGIPQGSVRLAGFPMVLATFLPPLLRRFKQLYPGIEVVQLEVSDDEVETLLEAQLVDLGVVLNPAPERRSWLLGRDSWVAVLPEDHPWQASTIDLETLLAQPFVLATGGCSVNARSLAAEAGIPLADVRVEVREWNSAFSLVRERLGVTLVPQSTLPVQREGLRVLELSTGVEREFALVAAPGRESSVLVQAFLSTLEEF
ncbi:LysR family transcriptional regulator [Pseudomonas protegens]|jgi:DNA-binding transcriptional LysR family regulator|uniref:LysR family transcriptional regulator n=2 Tax=Pseudomonas protegens TaxID=380021 RepID=A0ABY2VGW8_9PSED|nr:MULTISPECIES: LysR family transcriptional regulator [Pseudomonas]APC22016.1 LysR family transcriptional regulator [Pseudomonas protegens]ASE22011.1 LysR family transcriptional regulator [Pseudomonas protegens]MBB1611410.1 LysR family transcriptional regulator [Pseudomonas sp. UMC65]MBB1621545.1 LysR family transcriptional regulator [Pseudomonas sp. UME65]MBF0637862.1 LysR family transcriptional regulator [Pseudomonas protegens]